MFIKEKPREHIMHGFKWSELVERDEVTTFSRCLLCARGGARLFTGCYHVSFSVTCFCLSWACEKLETQKWEKFAQVYTAGKWQSWDMSSSSVSYYHTINRKMQDGEIWTQVFWTWVYVFFDCAHSQAMGSQRVRLDWATNTQAYKMPEKCLVELAQNWEWTTTCPEKFMDPLNKAHLGLNLSAAI